VRNIVRTFVCQQKSTKELFRYHAQIKCVFAALHSFSVFIARQFPYFDYCNI
jgi:hypothetical protein